MEKFSQTFSKRSLLIVGIILTVLAIGTVFLVIHLHATQVDQANLQSNASMIGGIFPNNKCPQELIRSDQVRAIDKGITYQLDQVEQQWIPIHCPNTKILGKSSNQTTLKLNNSATVYAQTNFDALSTCPKQIFSAIPVDTTTLDSIIPLGSINVPEQSTPTDHINMLLKRGMGTTFVKTNLQTPASGVIRQVILTDTTTNGNEHIDYGITFAPCKEVNVIFDHVQTLTDALKSQINNQWDHACNTSIPANGVSMKQCIKHLDFPISLNEVIGTVGGTDAVAGFGFGTYDTRVKNIYANVTRQPDQSAYSVCPIDYYAPSNQQLLYKYITRTIQPICGSAVQDTIGTAQGNWFNTTLGLSTIQNWNQQFSLIHNNIDPRVGIVAIGGILTTPGQEYFNPRHVGLINREPSEIKSDGLVYCFQDEPTDAGIYQELKTGRTILQLKDSNTMLIEFQNKSCSESIAFTTPTTYIR